MNVDENQSQFLTTPQRLLQKKKSDDTISRHLANIPFKYNFKSEAVDASKSKNWAILNVDTTCVTDAPRKAVVANFRLLTNHDFLRTPPIALFVNLVNLNMTPEQLDMCSALSSLNCIDENYWRARVLMA
ncbi:hypothetical protein CDAR_221351 [Caerostris darwini]|uniref:Uncharacterized protein n=1 Tax=Caerostris darwini TaxID=1538125 RepID=A0AAV4WLB4_9ARAC|nr:hypothetical protein CDAR_221351 [Caerostris darwini]